MIRLIFTALSIFYIFLSCSCNATQPERYLAVTVGPSNTLAGFAHNTFSRLMKNPPAKTSGDGHPAVLTRKELIEEKIRFSRQMLVRLQQMEYSPEERDIVTSSIALHQFVIQVYETDYMLLARLYDDGASIKTIERFDSAIKNKYANMFELHYENLIRGGKLYAAKHKLKVPTTI
ncbi:MAG: hypothetical protein EOO13_05020 [Chitinophagaceae bacterium]|nr:MAG: hypothetical protein EOO13_05020 [Chitinophagaceae bacterium]